MLTDAPKITISFTPQQLQVLNNALVELPFKVAAPMIDHINKEIVAQQQKVENEPDLTDATVKNMF